MLDRDPHADKPPDLSILRPRSRSHKPKSNSKKQPQRGLGVAQLEKLRIEEQNKQNEAACLASLQQQHSRHIHFQQQEQVSSFNFHPQNLVQRQGHTPTLCVPLHMKHMEVVYGRPGQSEPCSPLSSAKLNFVQSNFFPLATMANRCQNTPFSLHIPQHQFPTEDETSTSLTSQMHDLCSPIAPQMRPSSAESRLSPILKRTSTASLFEKSWLNHLYDREPNAGKEAASTDLSSAQCHDSATKSHHRNQTFEGGIDTAIATLHGESGDLHLCKLLVRNAVSAVPVTDSRPRSKVDRVFDGAQHRGSHRAASMAGGNRMEELSSFQNISLCPAWSHVDKVVNRKRSWACTQDMSRSLASSKGVDLNTFADESELTEQSPYLTTQFTSRDDWNPFLGKIIHKCNDEDKSCSCCDSSKVDERAALDAYAHENTYTSLPKQSINSEGWTIETPGEFLTLGPSSSMVEKTEVLPTKSGSCGNHLLLKALQTKGFTWNSEDSIMEQARDSSTSKQVFTRRTKDMVPSQYQTSYDQFLRRDAGSSNFSICNKMETLLEDCSTNQSMNLELRLSI